MQLHGKQVRLTKVERQTYGRYTLARTPCKNFYSSQTPEEKHSVCYNCGWLRKRHRSISRAR